MRFLFFFAVAAAVYPAFGAEYRLSDFESDPQSDYQLAMFSVPVADELAVERMRLPRLKVYVAEHCGPCEAWKRDVLPRLKAAGWEVGTNIEIVEAGNIPAPRFEWVTSEGVVSTLNGYKTREAFNAWHRVAVNGPIQVSAGVCKCGEACPCRASVTSESVIRTDRKIPDNFQFTGVVEPQGIFDPTFQQSGNCASGMCGPVQSYGYAMGSCASGQCGPMQAVPAQQQHSHQGAARGGPVRRVLFSGGCR